MKHPREKYDVTKYTATNFRIPFVFEHIKLFSYDQQLHLLSTFN